MFPKLDRNDIREDKGTCRNTLDFAATQTWDQFLALPLAVYGIRVTLQEVVDLLFPHL